MNYPPLYLPEYADKILFDTKNAVFQESNVLNLLPFSSESIQDQFKELLSVTI